MSEGESKRGGYRLGSGRKRISEGGKTLPKEKRRSSVIAVRVTESERDLLEAMARAAGKSISRYVADVVLKSIE